MDVNKIYSENPEEDLWTEILQFTYEANVKRFFAEKNIEPEDGVINGVISSFLQAYEYYKSSKVANLQISPLLIYYGTTNLLYGMSLLLKGKNLNIHHHGMSVISTTEDYIGNVKIVFENKNVGGIHNFCKAIGFTEDLCSTGEWSLKDFLSLVPEVQNDYMRCYNLKYSNVILLEEFITPEGLVQKIRVNEETQSLILEMLNNVKGFKENYLKPQIVKNTIGEMWYVLRYKMGKKGVCEYSLSEQPYLKLGIEKNGRKISMPTLVSMYCGLYIMGSLCRYNPQLWSPFVINDNSGEKILIEKFIYYCRRMIPNIVINTLYNKRLIYVYERYSRTNLVENIGKHELQDIVIQTIFNQKNNLSRG